MFFLRTNTARPQPETSTGRRQVDDEDTHQSLSNTSNASRSAATAVSNSTANVTDDLGPLPPGWQMSKTENERMFFIDHINKRTTWVKNEFFRRKFSLKTPNLFQVDPRTGKPSPLPGAQREINQNGPLPVIEIVRMNSISIFVFLLATLGSSNIGRRSCLLH